LHTSEIYKNRSWAIADGDDAGKDVISQLKIKFSSWDSSFFLNFEKSNFEEYYPARFRDEISEVLTMEKSKEKREKKAELLKSVIAWMNKNQQEAKQALGASAKEVIEKIGQIVKSITP